MSGPVPITIRAALAGREERFAQAIEAREHRRAGFGDRGMTPTLDEVLERNAPRFVEALIIREGWGPEDFDYAAARLGAVDDEGMRTLGRHMRHAADEIRRAEVELQMSQTNEAMRMLGESGIPLVEHTRTAIDRRDSPVQHPRQRAPLAYPVGVKPVAEPEVDADRAARGAMQPPMSQALRNFAKEVAGLARLSSNARQKGRLLRRAEELSKMSVTQYRRETESEVALADDPTEASNVLDRLAADMDDQARAGGAQDDDSFRSFDDWDADPRQGSDDAAAGDVDAQLEDVPHLPPGKRVGEDDLGDASLHADDVPGRRKNAATHLALPKGSAYRGKPAGRYSAFSGRESLRESDLTAQLIEDQRLHWYGSHGSW